MSKFKKVLFSILFWVVSLTWGAPLTIVGLIVTGIAILCGGKPHKNGCSYIVEIGGNWGGLSLGAVALCGSYNNKYSSYYNHEWFEHTRAHEFGHAIQHLVLGIFQLFLVQIPSAIRYWYHRIRRSKGLSNKAYDQAIFEYTASKYGYYWMSKLDDNFHQIYTFKRR